MEENLNLIILTSDMLFQCIEVSLNLLCLLALQLYDDTAVIADPLVHVVYQVLLLVNCGLDVFHHIVESTMLVLALVHPGVKS